MKDKEWQTNGTYDYIAEKLIKSEGPFNLVVTPNIEASPEQVVALVKAFSEEVQQQPAAVSPMYK